MKKALFVSLFLLAAENMMAKSFYDLKAIKAGGKELMFSQFQGKAFLVVNTASQCGYTPQYEGLETLHKKYEKAGLVVLAFPSASFKQEPLAGEDLSQFCKLKFGVTFPVLDRVDVTGAKKHPVFKYLTEEGKDKGEIQWNFEKFVLNRKGEVIARFPSKVIPDSPEVKKALEVALK